MTHIRGLNCSPFLFFLFFLKTIFGQAYALDFVLLHTNDLHSYLEHSDHMPDRGGYGTLKNFIASEKSKAQKENLPVLTLDAGDFMEGNAFYLADKGKKTFQAMNMIGYDAVTMGNHDYLMGTEDLDLLLKDVPPNFHYLAANFYADKKWKNIHEQMRRWSIFTLNGVKIGVVGLTTSDFLYKWRLQDAKIGDEVKACKKAIKEMKAAGAQIYIALTHLGTTKDRALALAVPELDLVVGGHSHDFLYEPFWIQHQNKKVAIVQTGEHGKNLGKLKLHWNEETKLLTVEDYRLLPVWKKEYGESEQHTQHVDETNKDLWKIYGLDWLDNEIVGQSNLQPEGLGGNPILWGYFITDSMRVVADTDIAVHTQAMSGNDYPIGPITRRSLFNSNPRIFEFDDPMGYRIYTFKMSGAFLHSVFKAVINFDIPLYFSGVKFEVERKANGKVKKIKNIRYAGEKINPLKLYSVAMSEGIVRGGLEISSATKLIFYQAKKTEHYMWTALEEWSRHFTSINPDYLDVVNSQKIWDQMHWHYKDAPLERMIIDPTPITSK